MKRVLILKKGIPPATRNRLVNGLMRLPVKYESGLWKGEEAIFIQGSSSFSPWLLTRLPGVREVVQPSTPYFLASRDTREGNTVIQVGSVRIGDGSFVIIAGPCSVECREQIIATAKVVKKAGAHLLRGGVYKPRTSPYSFQGLGKTGLQYLSEARKLTGLPVVTEVLSPEDIERVCSVADVLQIGSRNMQNFPLLKAVGKTSSPILLKRGMMATLEEFLLAAEYILSEGNDRVILCERGIRTFETSTRNTLDISCVPLLKELSHLPVIVDPSHACGRRSLVLPLSRAALAVGADGLMVEVHPDPVRALSDGFESLDFPAFTALMKELHRLRHIFQRS